MNLKQFNYKKIIIIFIWVILLMLPLKDVLLNISFFGAIKMNCVSLMRLEMFISPNLSNATGLYGDAQFWRSLHYAVRCGHTDTVKILLKNKSDINAKMGIPSWTALNQASAYNQKEMIKILLQNGADPNIKGFTGLKTPIFFSVDHKDIEVANILIKYGADLNIQDTDGKSPLFYSVIECQDKDMTELLLKNGADPSIRDNDNKTVKDYLIEERVKANDKEKIRIDKMIKIIEKYEKPQKK